MTTCTIMMVTYNRLDLTKQTLSSLWNSTDYPFNLVIVDNGSTDGTVEYLKDIFDPLKLHDAWPFGNCTSMPTVHLNEKNLGIAAGRNLCLKLAGEKYSNEWMATIDNDVELPQGWLKQAISIMQSNLSFGAIGVNFEPFTYPEVTLNGHTFREKPQGNLGTACMVFNKKIHKLLGYFNTDYKFFGEEDADFGIRMRVLNYRMGYLLQDGINLGSGENDQGEYREFKNEWHAKNLAKFQDNCRKYYSKAKSYYLPFRID